MTSLLAIQADPLAPDLQTARLTHPDSLAAVLGRDLASLGWRSAPSGWSHRRAPASDDDVLAACRDLVQRTLDDLPRPPRVTLIESITRATRTLAFWERHPDGEKRADHYRDRLAALRRELRVQRDAGDPLRPLRRHLTTAAHNLQGDGFCTYFLRELRDVMTAHPR